MAAKTWSNAGGDGLWSNGANWGGSVPATTDTVTFDATSTANCTIDNLGTWSGGTLTIAATYSGVITQNSGINLTTAAYSQAGGTFTGHSAATFTSTTFSVTGGTFNQGGAFTSTTFGCTVAGIFVGGSASMSTTGVTFSGTASLTATSGTWTLAGSFTQSNTPTFSAHGGTINVTANCTMNAPACTFNRVTINQASGDFAVSASTTVPLGSSPAVTQAGFGAFSISGTISASGVISVTGGSGGFLSFGGTISGATGLTVTNAPIFFDAASLIPANFSVTMNITSSTAQTFDGGGLTYGRFYRTGSGSGALLSFTGSNTFSEFKDNDGSVAHSIKFSTAATQTAALWTLGGSAGKLLTLISSSGGTPATLHMTGVGPVSADYMSVQDSTVDASPKWYAGANSTNVSGNTNWIFTAPVISNSYGDKFGLAQGGFRSFCFAPAQGR